METFSVDPLIQGWRRASEDIRREIGQRAVAAADRAATRIPPAYPKKSGRLRGSVRVTTPRGWTTSAGAIVPARVVRAGHPTAPHVHLVEQGSAVRQFGGRNRGRMPKMGPIFVPIVVAEREAFLRDAQAILDRNREVV